MHEQMGSFSREAGTLLKDMSNGKARGEKKHKKTVVPEMTNSANSTLINSLGRVEEKHQ